MLFLFSKDESEGVKWLCKTKYKIWGCKTLSKWTSGREKKCYKRAEYDPINHPGLKGASWT